MATILLPDLKLSDKFSRQTAEVCENFNQLEREHECLFILLSITKSNLPTYAERSTNNKRHTKKLKTECTNSTSATTK